MDRNKKRGRVITGANSTYRGYGMTTPQKPKKGMPARLRALLALLLLAVMLAIVVAYALQSGGREDIGRATRIGATLSQNVTPFGSSVIFYDGTTLHCVAATGGNEWSYQIGTNADYDATDNRIVAWSGNDLYIINNRGRLVYNNKMSDTIQFASAGESYVAVFVGEQDSGVVTVIDSNGQIVDNITVSGQTLLDVGFFKSTTSSSAPATEPTAVVSLPSTFQVTV